MNGTIVLTVLLMVGSGELKRTVTHATTSAFHPVLAGFIVGVFLFIFAAINGNVAQKICYLLIAFSLIVNGSGIASALGSSKISTPSTTVTGGSSKPTEVE